MESPALDIGGAERMGLPMESGHSCGDCSEEIHLLDRVVLVQVVLPQTGNSGIVSCDPFERGDGEYAYAPYFYHEGCWRALEERLQEYLFEADCLTVEDPHSHYVCDICNSGIRIGEPTGMAAMGELHMSRREPNGRSSISLELHRKKLMCLSCLRTLNDEVIEMWDHVSYNGECPICTYERAWRTGLPCDHVRE